MGGTAFLHFLEWQSCHSYAEGYGFHQNYQRLYSNIVFVRSQYDGGNIEQRAIGLGSLQNQRCQAKDLW